MNASLRILKSPLAVYDSEEIAITPGLTLHETFLQYSEAYQAPVDHVLCMVNQEEVPVDQWQQYQIDIGDVVILCPRSHGLDPITIAYIVIAVTAVASFALMSVPTIDTPGEIPEQSPSYELDAQGNKARLGKPVPVRYGTFRIYPDFATAPYREFIGDDQYLYQLFSIGQGDYDYADWKIGDTPLENFDEVDWEFYAPEQKVTLFRDSVKVSTDVTDTTLFAPNEQEFSDWSGPFVANEADTTAEELAVDLVFPRGLHFANDEGSLSTRNVTVRIEYRDIDEFGDYVGLGNYTLFEEKTFSAATVDSIRRTIRHPITTATGRVEVRAKRVNNTNNDYKQNDEVVWTGLKAYLESNQTYKHSTWAVKVKASDQLSSQNDRKFNVVATRKLQVWDGSQWNQAATRNPAWAFCDAIKAEYGGEYADTHLDLPAIKAVADTWDTRNDYFDGQFDTKGTLWAALKKICLVGRAYPYQFGAQFTIIRDEPKPGNAYMFNGRNIKARSLTVAYQTMDEFADDSVEIEYVDPLSWKKDTITAAVPGSERQRPKKVKLFGCTDRTQAHREAMFMAARQQHRNITAEFTTELDGRVLNYLDQAIVVQDLPKWGSGGEVIAQDGSVLTLSEPVEFEGAGDHHIYLRNDRGEAHGPYLCSGAGATNQVTVSGSLPSFIFTGNTKEKTYFAFSSPVAMPRKMLVEDVRASGEMEVKVKCVLDNDLVHSYDDDITSGAIVTPPATTPKIPIQFIIGNLVVVQGGTVQNPKLQLSWSPAEDALRYLIDVSYDDGESWSRAATVINNNAIIDVLPGQLNVRIAPQNDEIGTWFTKVVDVGSTFAVPAQPIGLALASTFDGIKVDVTWAADPVAVAWFVEVVDLSEDVRHDATVTTNAFSYSHDQAKLQGIGREFDIKVYAINANGVKSVASVPFRVKNEQTVQLTGVTATGLLDQILIEWNAPSEPDNDGYRVYASQTDGFTAGPGTLVEPNAKTRVYGLPITAGETWYIRVAAFDIWGTDELNFSAQVSATTSKITSTQIDDDSITTPKLAANAVTAQEIGVSQLSAISSDMGDVTAGTFKTDEVQGARFEASSIGDFPLWIGAGVKSSANGHAFFDKIQEAFVFQDPVSNKRLEIQPGSSLPFWYGEGTKSEANGLFYYDPGKDSFVVKGEVHAGSGSFTGDVIAESLLVNDNLQIGQVSPGVTYSDSATDKVTIGENQTHTCIYVDVETTHINDEVGINWWLGVGSDQNKNHWPITVRVRRVIDATPTDIFVDSNTTVGAYLDTGQEGAKPRLPVLTGGIVMSHPNWSFSTSGHTSSSAAVAALNTAIDSASNSPPLGGVPIISTDRYMHYYVDNDDPPVQVHEHRWSAKSNTFSVPTATLFSSMGISSKPTETGVASLGTLRDTPSYVGTVRYEIRLSILNASKTPYTYYRNRGIDATVIS